MTHPHLRLARRLATLLDSQFQIAGIRFGLDSLLGLFPGIGDLITFGLSLYLLWIGYQMKLPKAKLSAMIGNILLDTLVGGVPLLGDIVDLFYKANLRNLAILEKHTDLT